MRRRGRASGRVLAYLRAGDVFQVNLSRGWRAHFDAPPDPAALYARLRLANPDRREPLAAIQFGGWHGSAPATRLHLAYRLAPDDYRGGQAIQLIVEHLAAV